MLNIFASAEPDEDEYEDKQVDGQEDSTPMIFDEEIEEVLKSEPAWMGMIPRWWRAEDGTRFMFFSPTKEVELNPTGKQEGLQECIDCSWRGVIETENQPDEYKDYADYCPNCGRQLLEEVSR